MVRTEPWRQRRHLLLSRSTTKHFFLILLVVVLVCVCVCSVNSSWHLQHCQRRRAPLALCPLSVWVCCALFSLLLLLFLLLYLLPRALTLPARTHTQTHAQTRICFTFVFACLFLAFLLAHCERFCFCFVWLAVCVCLSVFVCVCLLANYFYCPLPFGFAFSPAVCERKSINFYLIFMSVSRAQLWLGLPSSRFLPLFASPFVLRLCHGSQSCLCDHPCPLPLSDCLSVCLGLFGFLHVTNSVLA